MRTPSTAQLHRDDRRPRGLSQERALGDLERERGGVERRARERIRHLEGETLARELLCGDVHADTERRVAALAPDRCLTACRIEDMTAEREDEPGLLGERDEVARKHEPAIRVLPTHERLDTDDAAVLQRDDRLVVDVELVGEDSALEVGLELEPLEDELVHRRLVEGIPALALALRSVHREVGAAHDLARRLRPPTRVQSRCSPARRTSDPAIARGSAIAPMIRLATVDGAFGVRDALDHHGELVAAEAGTACPPAGWRNECARRPSRGARPLLRDRGCRSRS